MNKHLQTSEAICQVKTDCIVLGIFEDGLTSLAKDIDKASKGLISRIIKNGDFTGKAGDTHLLHEVAGVNSPRLMLAGLGAAINKENAPLFFEKNYKKASVAVGKALKFAKFINVANYLPLTFAEKNTDKYGWAGLYGLINLERAGYTYAAKKKTEEKNNQPKNIYWANPKKDKNFDRAIKQGEAIYWAMEKMLLVANHPANLCTPVIFADYAKNWVNELAKTKSPININVLDKKAIEKQKMNCFLSVAQGSEQEPRLVEIKYIGKKGAPTIALVGKGVTFDTGGISLKPGSEMDHMKWDMCGAASVLGAILATAKLALPINLVAVMPLTENMPSSKAVKPSDVVTTMSGLTVENLNTDAEGRLILCDAITYTQKHHQPKTLIDVATLTGACVVALGHLRIGLVANDDKLAQELINAGKTSLDSAWQMPYDTDYLEGMKSNFADIANISGRGAGTITAAMFLSKFVEKNVSWGHLDIAGVAYNGSGENKGATGRPLPLLMQYIINLSKQ